MCFQCQKLHIKDSKKLCCTKGLFTFGSGCCASNDTTRCSIKWTVHWIAAWDTYTHSSKSLQASSGQREHSINQHMRQSKIWNPDELLRTNSSNWRILPLAWTELEHMAPHTGHNGGMIYAQLTKTENLLHSLFQTISSHLHPIPNLLHLFQTSIGQNLQSFQTGLPLWPRNRASAMLAAEDWQVYGRWQKDSVSTLKNYDKEL